MSGLDDALRTMLAERSRDIVEMPSEWAELRLDPGGRRRPRRIGRRVLLVAAAAVVVAALAGTLVAIGSFRPGHDAAPAGPATGQSTTHAPDPGPTSAPTPAPTPAVAGACTASLPSAWRTALTSTGSTFGARSAYPVGVTNDGDLLVARDFGRGGGRDLVLVSPGQHPRKIFTVSRPEAVGIYSADLDRHQLIVSVGADPRPPKGTEPGSSPKRVIRTYVIDLRTGTRTQLTPTPLRHRVIAAPVRYGGTLYWIEQPDYGSRSGRLRSYDLATGSTHTVYSGTGFTAPKRSAAGIQIGGRLVVRATLPAEVASALKPEYRMHVQTDGFAYAWVAGPRTVGWWAPGQAQPVLVRLPHALPLGRYLDLLVVVGHYVIVDGSDLVDMSTGAVAEIPRDTRNVPVVSAGGHVAAGVHYVGTGHWQDGYWVDPQPQVRRTDVTTLPALRC